MSMLHCSNDREWTIMAFERPTRERPARIGPPRTLKIADVEYRVVLNKATMEWNVFRNGAATDVLPRKKKQSAVDSAVRDAKAELAASKAEIIVTCVDGRKAQTVWKTPSA